MAESTQRIGPEIPSGYREIVAEVGPLPEGGMWGFPGESKWYDDPPQIDEDDIESNIRVIVPIKDSRPVPSGYREIEPKVGPLPTGAMWSCATYYDDGGAWNDKAHSDREWYDWEVDERDISNGIRVIVPISSDEPMKTIPSFPGHETELAEKVKRLEDEVASLRRTLTTESARAYVYREVIEMMLEARS